MKTVSIAALLGLAAVGAQAQAPGPFGAPRTESLQVTATRTLEGSPTLRDAVIITREDIEDAGPVSLGELLERRAGVELRATGGPGQPQGIFIRGAGAAQTLVLIDGLRAGSATQGATSIENIPLEMIERIEVVKGPMSSLYGSEAAGGVIQVFTRGKAVPNLFVTAAYGSRNDRRISAGIATAEKDSALSFSMGARAVDAASATNPRATFSFDPDKDPYRNAFANLRASHRMWQGELLQFEAFASRARVRFDAGIPFDGIPVDDRSDQTIAGARFTSSTQFASWWSSRLAIGTTRDKLAFNGQFPSLIETRQDQAAWINEFGIPGGNVIAGYEFVRQHVIHDDATPYDQDSRETNSGFVSATQSWEGQRIEASARRDQDGQFGKRNTGSASYGIEWPGWLRISGTFARGFRAPTFNDLYAHFPGYIPDPTLLPERSRSREIAIGNAQGAAFQWSATGFDNRLEDLIVFDFGAGTVRNVARARIRGVELSAEARWLGARWRAAFTAQRPRDEETGLALQGRAQRFGNLEVSRPFGAWTAGLNLHASGARFDSTDQSPASRLPGYVVFDARVRYAIAPHWSAELAASNLGDKRRESAVGYDAPRRELLLSVRFEAF
jgi:vitamin B12 transporter